MVRLSILCGLYFTIALLFFALLVLPGSLPAPFVLPEKLAKLNRKKVIYVSVGSMSSAYKPLMDHIVEVLARLPNYAFILSGGPLLDQLKLAENIYAERFVNQLAVLQTVSCMVSHGGEYSLAARTLLERNSKLSSSSRTRQ